MFLKISGPIFSCLNILVCACLGTNKSSPTASTLELHLDDLWAPWNRKERRGEEESREYCFLDCLWSVFWNLVGFICSKEKSNVEMAVKLALVGIFPSWVAVPCSSLQHCNPLQGSTGKYRENPVIKTGNLQWEQGSPVMKAGFSLWELTYREKL